MLELSGRDVSEGVEQRAEPTLYAAHRLMKRRRPVIPGCAEQPAGAADTDQPGGPAAAARPGPLRRIGRERRNVGGLGADIGSRARGQRLHKLVMKRRRLSAECLKALTVVGVAAAALAELIVEPRLAKSEAAAVTNSGAAITNDISVLPPRHRPIGMVKSIPRAYNVHKGHSEHLRGRQKITR